MQELIELAKKNGRLYVAEDVYEALKPYLAVNDELKGLRIEVSKHLEPGTIMAIAQPLIDLDDMHI